MQTTYHSNFAAMCAVLTDNIITDSATKKFADKAIQCISEKNPRQQWNLGIAALMRHDKNFILDVVRWARSNEAQQVFVSMPHIRTWLIQCLNHIDSGIKLSNAFQFDRCDEFGQPRKGQPKKAWDRKTDAIRLAWLYAIPLNFGWKKAAEHMIANNQIFSTGASGGSEKDVLKAVKSAKDLHEAIGRRHHLVEPMMPSKSAIHPQSEADAIIKKYDE